ncbi:MAG: hypothetical protein AB7U75_11490 [Hyphomicrobiaceae bacterium]
MVRAFRFSKPAAVLPAVVAGSRRPIGTGHDLIGLIRAVGFVVACIAAGMAVLGALVAGGAAPASAIEIGFAPKPVLRKVLALYDGAAEPTPSDTRLHRFAEMPINYLGFELVYRDINATLPSQEDLTDYRAVLTWLLEPLQKPDALAAWLEKALETPGLRYVVLGDVLPDDGARVDEAAARLYGRLGLSYDSEHLESGFDAEPLSVDALMIGFERPLDKVLPGFPVVRPLPDRIGQLSVHLALGTPKSRNMPPIAAVVTGPGGGFAAEGFTIFYEPTADRENWILNPFAFFSKALGDGRFPIPDVTTAAGRRIYFSHIDGDGWNNQSEIESYKATGTLSSEVIWREAIAPYPDLPVSVALISCDIDPQFGADVAAARVARALFALPQVEVASHTHTHPFNWSFYAQYDREAEVRLIDTQQRPTQSWRDRLSGAMNELAGRTAPVARSSKYIAGSDDLPRTYLKNPFDLGSEVLGSLRIAESLAPAGKKAMLYQWSGDTSPFEAAIHATRLAGVRNINGGDSRFDREFPSIAYVPPIARTVGRERQIYAANSNENTYTNDWTGPYYGFFMLEETLRNTESPRRLKPFNLYYHMYSGEKPAALAAVRHFLDKARSQAVIPVAASEYAAIADDFFAVRIEQTDASAWAVSNFGALETVRFDNAQALGVDMEMSVGILGATRHNGSLYVTLDRAVDRAVVQLAEREVTDAYSRDRQARPQLRESRWRLSGLTGDSCRFALKAEGYGRGDMSFATAPGRTFDVSVERGDEVLTSVSATADAMGELSLALNADAREPVEVSFVCHE